MVLRAAVRDFPDIEVVGINDLLEPDYLGYMAGTLAKVRAEIARLEATEVN